MLRESRGYDRASTQIQLKLCNLVINSWEVDQEYHMNYRIMGIYFYEMKIHFFKQTNFTYFLGF